LHSPQLSSPKAAPPGGDKSSEKSFSSLKVIGAISATISLLLALNQVTGIVQKFRIHHKDFSETMKVGEQQLQRADYQASFDSFKHAVELDPIDHQAQQQQAQAGMLWLENVHSAQLSFKETADRVQPVLERALTGVKGPQAADLLAHIGWANFLRVRDGAPQNLAIDETYKQALSLDAQNVYAHAMWGHWTLWNSGDVNAAREHFSQALASGKVRPYVRTMQTSALLNSHHADDELLRVADEMRRSNEPLSGDDRHRIFWELFVTPLTDTQKLATTVKAVRPEDAEATYDWLSQGYEGSEAAFVRQARREYIVAFLAETAGNKTDALTRYRALKQELRKTTKASNYLTLQAIVDSAIKRLS